MSNRELTQAAKALTDEAIRRTAAQVARGVLSRRAGLQAVRSMEMAS